MFKNLLLEEDSEELFLQEQDDSHIQISISDFSYPKLNAQVVMVKKLKKGKLTIQRGLRQLIARFKKKCQQLESKKPYNEDLIERTDVGQDIKDKAKHNLKYIKKTTSELQEKIRLAEAEYSKNMEKTAKDVINDTETSKVEAMKAMKQAAQEWIKQAAEKQKTANIQQTLKSPPKPLAALDAKEVADTVLKVLIGGMGIMMTNNLNAKQVQNYPLKCPTLKQAKRVSQKIEKTEKEYQKIENKTETDIDKYSQKIIALNQLRQNYQQCQKLSLYY